MTTTTHSPPVEQKEASLLPQTLSALMVISNSSILILSAALHPSSAEAHVPSVEALLLFGRQRR
jgi:hypothetical protein